MKYTRIGQKPFQLVADAQIMLFLSLVEQSGQWSSITTVRMFLRDRFGLLATVSSSRNSLSEFQKPSHFCGQENFLNQAVQKCEKFKYLLKIQYLSFIHNAPKYSKRFKEIDAQSVLCYVLILLQSDSYF